MVKYMAFLHFYLLGIHQVRLRRTGLKKQLPIVHCVHRHPSRSQFAPGGGIYNWKLFAVAEVAHQEIGVAPVFLDLDPGGQVDLGAHKLLAVGSGHGGDFLQHGALLTDDDALVAGTLAVNGGIDVDDTAVPLRELGDLNSSAVGNLLSSLMRI